MKKTILVVQTAFLGDLLLGIPFYKAIRNQWPEHELVLICKKGLLDFFIQTKLFDTGYEIEKGNSHSYSEVLEKLNQKTIEIIFCPHESLRSAFFVQKIKAKQKIGFKKWTTSWIFDRAINKPKSWPEPLRQMSLLWGMATDSLTPQDSNKNELEQNRKEIESDFFSSSDVNGALRAIPEKWSASVRSQLENNNLKRDTLLEKFGIAKNQKKMIVLFPGSVWPTKMWTENGFSSLGQKLEKENYQVLIMGGKGEEEVAQRLNKQIPNSINLVGKTSIYETILILTRVQAVIGNDSASSHMASAADAPVLAVFGPTVLDFGYRPWTSKVSIAQIKDLSCRPCGPHGHKVCPLGTHECMTKLSAETVYRGLKTLLNNP